MAIFYIYGKVILFAKNSTNKKRKSLSKSQMIMEILIKWNLAINNHMSYYQKINNQIIYNVKFFYLIHKI